MAARTVTDVILGEAAYGPGRFEDMRNIASVIQNRARATGVTPQQVVANQREFNAYGKALPAGAPAFRNLAERAWNEIQQTGPVHSGTFYATPSATKNLPSGLRQVGQTNGHVYYEDPKNRAIGTALGYRQPTALTAAQRAIADQTRQPVAQPRNVPTPTFASRPTPTLSASLSRNPVSSTTVSSASAVPAGLTATALRGGRIGPNTTTGVPTPTSRPSQIASVAPDVSRFGSYMPTETMPKSIQNRFAEMAGVTGSRVAPQSVTAGLAPTPQQQNLADRLGTLSPTVDVASLRTRSVPTPTSRPMSVGSLLGISPAAAATPTARPAQMTARVPAGALTASITPGAVTSFSPRSSIAPANRFTGAAPVSGRVPTPTAAPQRVATPTARPQAARVQSAPTTRASAPAARDPWGGLRQVASSQPQIATRTPTASRAAPAAPASSGPFGLSRGTVGRAVGAALGSAVGGPVGGLLGGFIGGRIGNGTGGNAAGRGGQASSTSGTASRGSSERSGGFGGFAERDSVVGPDGGRRSSGGSKSSGGKSGGSGNSGGSRSEGSGKSESSGGKSGGGGKGGKK